MRVHKILNGEGAEQYLPFALSKLKSLQRLAKQIVVQRYVIDETHVLVEFNPNTGQHFVRIDRSEGVLGYEFFTTHDDVTAFPVAWWATAVVPRKADGAWELSPLKLSTAFTDSAAPIVPRDPLSRAINGQRNAEYHWWPAADGVQAADAMRTKPYFLTSTYGCFSWQAPDMDFQNFMGSYTTIDGASAEPHDYLTDVGVDVVPALYESGRVTSGFPLPVLPNWPRRAACMEVGGRRFVILSDMQSNFYAYPDSYLTGDPVLTAFHEQRAKVVKASDYLPAGVAVPSVATMYVAPRGAITEYGARWAVPFAPPAPILAPYSANPGSTIEPGADETKQYQKHHYLWDFHPSGARAAAVVHIDLNNGHEALLSGTGETGVPAYCLAEYGPQYEIQAADAGREWVAEAGGVTTFNVSARAVVEVAFDIVITGPGDGDFTFSVTTQRTITGGWYFDAQYAYCDARLEALGVFAGDLLTDEVRLHGVAVGGAGARPTVYDEFVVTRNHDRGADVQTHCVAMNRPYKMVKRTRFVERFALGTYPGEPPQISRYFIEEPSSPGAHGIARLLSSDLRSMSKVFEQSRDGSSVGLHVVLFGHDRQGSSIPRTQAESLALGHALLPAGFLSSGSYWLGGDVIEPNSIAAAFSLGLHRLAWDHITYRYGFDPSVHTGITSHPDGHVAVFAFFKNPYNAAAQVVPFDLIEYRRIEPNEAGEPVEVFDQTTHVAAFEKAFGVDFDLPAFVAAANSHRPIVMQRFASWRNIKLPKLKAGQGTFGMNPRIPPA